MVLRRNDADFCAAIYTGDGAILQESDFLLTDKAKRACVPVLFGYIAPTLWYGEVAEWSKAHAWNACRRVTVSRVRIPVSPPLQL